MKLAAVLLIENGIILNKYHFSQYLPVGKILHTVKRLQELQIDEIIMLNKGHSDDPVKDFMQIQNSDFSRISLSTPMAYGGGIRNMSHVEKLIDSGVERVVLPSREIYSKLSQAIAHKYGEQSIIFHLPYIKKTKMFKTFDSKKEFPLIQKIGKLPENFGGEIVLTSTLSEGVGKLNVDELEGLINRIPANINIVYSGGVSSTEQVDQLSSLPINGVGLGNILNSKEAFVLRAKKYCERLDRPLYEEEIDA